MSSPVATADDIVTIDVVESDTARRPKRRGSLRDRVEGTLPAAAAPVAADPLAQALSTVGDRWSLAVVAQLVSGPQRFNDMAAALVPIARTVLSDRLRRLEDAGIIARRQYQDTPARHNYRLTVAGADLARVCGVLADWGSRHLGDGTPALTHTTCDGAITPVYSCEACGVVPARELATS